MVCVTCPNLEFGFCGALNGDVATGTGSFNWQRYRTARPGDQLANRSEASDDVFLLCAGWAFRYIGTGSGRRQILNFLLPGDLFSVVNVFDPQFQSSVMAVTEVQVSCFERSEVRARFATNPALQRAIENSCKEEHAGADELLTVLGQRSAQERVAYLLLNLTRRLRTRSVIREDRYQFPLRQRHIADALGLTPVHVNRTLSVFRDRGLCTLSNGILTLLQPSELERLGSLD